MKQASHDLNPQEVAQAAKAIYSIRVSKDVVGGFRNTQIRDKFDLENTSRFEGNSGIFQSSSGFGVIGKGSGTHSDEAIIVTRGTKTAADWFSNLIAVSTRSSNNKSVHKGFNNIFNSFDDQLFTKLRLMNPSVVHCVGHSLGGALATLIAEKIKVENIADPYLYTFGCPRVGDYHFSDSFTRDIGASRIHRSYHKTDIVPMFPVWPFVHSPTPGLSCYIDSPGNHPGAEYHDMKYYIKSVKDHSNWDTLHKRHPKTNIEEQVENWLDSDSPLAFTGNTIAMINSAIMYVIKKIALAGLQFVIGESANIVDMMAAFLTKAAKLTKNTFVLVKKLMIRILTALGRTAAKVKDITVDFVKLVLDALALALQQATSMAIRLTHKVL